jgi:hypothetical protein
MTPIVVRGTVAGLPRLAVLRRDQNRKGAEVGSSQMQPLFL